MEMPTRASRSIRIAAAAATLTFALSGCGDSTTDPHPLAGTWVATSFTSTIGAQTTDQLAEGGHIDITINTNGNTIGTLVIPEGNEDGSDYTASLVGTWSMTSSGTVTFDHAADTFLRDMEFTVQGNTLVGERTFGTMHIEVTLTKMLPVP